MRNDSRSEIKTNDTPLTQTKEEPNIPNIKTSKQATTQTPQLQAPITTNNTTSPQPSKNKEFIAINSDNNKGMWYGIQILASKKELNINDKLFSEINEPIYYYFENEWHKYYLGVSQNKLDTQSKQKEIGKRYNGAFLITFKNGKKE